MLEPFHGRVYDPACGSGGMFVQSAEFVRAHGGKRNDISVYGQEFTDTTWKLAKMNLALRGIEADLGDRSADSFTQDLHPDLRADFVLANPPFNVSNWWDAKLQDDPRWKYGTPPASNANFGWVQHFIYGQCRVGAAHGADELGEARETLSTLPRIVKWRLTSTVASPWRTNTLRRVVLGGTYERRPRAFSAVLGPARSCRMASATEPPPRITDTSCSPFRKKTA
jgi:N-6 DNA Methylase